MGWMDGWREGARNGWMDGEMDGWMEVEQFVLIVKCFGDGQFDSFAKNLESEL